MKSGERKEPGYDVAPFRLERNAILDTLRWAKKRMNVATLLEVDVTAARTAIRSRRARNGTGLSFTAWVSSCVARAAAEHPRVHAIRRGKRELIVFHDVDVAVAVERAIAAESRHEVMPMPVVIRKANEKSVREIHDELRRAQSANVPAGTASIERGLPLWVESLFFRFPYWIRDLVFWRWLLRNPFRIKRTMGTVMVTSVGATAPGVLGWGIPLSLHPVAVGIGGIAPRHTAVSEAEILALTLVFDHAVVDGGPFGRFTRRLHELMTHAHGLAVDETIDIAESSETVGVPDPS